MSDTEAGMAVGSAAFARLQNNALFRATMAVAREEITQNSGSGIDTAMCEAEAAALGLKN